MHTMQYKQNKAYHDPNQYTNNGTNPLIVTSTLHLREHISRSHEKSYSSG
eukprot:m.357102 g.357102  ORF g.357102 m.357102 type:complete len:50 (+) comp17700_c0_seq1:290-439(+)